MSREGNAEMALLVAERNQLRAEYKWVRSNKVRREEIRQKLAEVNKRIRDVEHMNRQLGKDSKKWSPPPIN